MLRFGSFILIVLIVWSEALIAAKPTIEGLFRNGDNADLIGETAILSLEIEGLETALNITSSSSEMLQSEGGEEVSGEEMDISMEQQSVSPERRFVKLHFRELPNGEVNLIQAEYPDSEMKNYRLWDFKVFKNLRRKIKHEGQDPVRLFYSLMMMFSLNDSSTITHLLKKYNLDFLENTEVMSEEKQEVYKRYREYLVSIKEDKNLKEELISPLAPEDEEEKKIIHKIMTSAMYRSSDRIKMVRTDGDFYWQLTLEKGDALFYNETHRLHMLHLQLAERRYTIYCDDYVLYNGVHAFPREIRIEVDNGQAFRIKVMKYVNFEDKKYNFYQREERYTNALKRIHKRAEKKGESIIPLPAFAQLNFLY